MMKKIFIACCSLVCLLCIMAFVQTGSKEPVDDEKIIALRNVGHKLLQQFGDFASNLPPVKKLNGNTFQIQFAHPLTFIADSLVATVDAFFTRQGLHGQYLVKVINSTSGETIYTYQVFDKPDKSIIPCLGRDQPSGAYIVTVTFGGQAALAGLSKSYFFPAVGLVLSLSSIAIVLFYNKRTKAIAVAAGEHTIAIGGYAFYIDRGILKHNNANIHLTAKELKVLKMFALRPNVIIERQELVKNIWEDEGLVVGGRSLDVFVSKLRKKLGGDPAVNIVNAHGLGYKLQVAP